MAGGKAQDAGKHQVHRRAGQAQHAARRHHAQVHQAAVGVAPAPRPGRGRPGRGLGVSLPDNAHRRPPP